MRDVSRIRELLLCAIAFYAIAGFKTVTQLEAAPSWSVAYRLPTGNPTAMLNSYFQDLNVDDISENWARAVATVP